MKQLRTAGELRGFLSEVLVGIRSGTIDSAKAHAIAKISAQINASLSVEVETALQLKRMGGGDAIAGSMIIATHDEPAPPLAIADAADEIEDAPFEPAPKPRVVVEVARRDGDKIWCEQCEARVTTGQAVACRDAHCKAQAAA